MKNYKDKEYRVIPTILGNRAKAYQLQHKTWFGWINTKFNNGYVIDYNREELVGLVYFLKSDPVNIK